MAISILTCNFDRVRSCEGLLGSFAIFQVLFGIFVDSSSQRGFPTTITRFFSEFQILFGISDFFN